MLMLIRETRVGNAIIGRLYHNGGFICWTLENAETAIPAGLYSIKNSISPKFKRELPLIYNETTVKPSRGVRIHAGNSWKDSNACVLVGMKRDCTKETIYESKLAETMVTMLCRSVTEMAIVE
jgi:hypothetical protein